MQSVCVYLHMHFSNLVTFTLILLLDPLGRLVGTVLTSDFARGFFLITEDEDGVGTIFELCLVFSKLALSHFTFF